MLAVVQTQLLQHLYLLRHWCRHYLIGDAVGEMVGEEVAQTNHLEPPKDQCQVRWLRHRLCKTDQYLDISDGFNAYGPKPLLL